MYSSSINEDLYRDFSNLQTYCEKLAKLKAKDVAKIIQMKQLLDLIVLLFFDGKFLSKPKSRWCAFERLKNVR